MFFRNLLNKMRGRQRMMNAGRMGSNFLPRVNKGIMSMMNPNMQFGLNVTPSMKARMMGLPDPVGFQLPPQPGGGMPGMRSDIMPRDPGFGVNIPKRPPIMPGPIGMKDGGEFPNAGLAALAKERPDVVKKILGKANGGEISFGQVYQRLSNELGPLSNQEYQKLRQMVYSTGLSYEGMKRVIQDARAAAGGSAASLRSAMGRELPSRSADMGKRVLEGGRQGLTAASRVMSQPRPGGLTSASKALANAIMKVSPTIRTPVAAGRGMLGRLMGPVTAGLGALSFMDYYNKLQNPEPETITLTQEEFDEMRRRAND